MVLTAFDPVELMTLLVALLGLIPVAKYYRPEAKLFTLGYLFIVLNLVSTNVEVIVLGDLFDLAEHAALSASGIAFLAAAYTQRKRLLGAEE